MDKLLYAVFSVYRYTRTSDSAYAMFSSYNYVHVHVHGDMGGGQGISHLPFTVHIHVSHDD